MYSPRRCKPESLGSLRIFVASGAARALRSLAVTLRPRNMSLMEWLA